MNSVVATLSELPQESLADSRIPTVVTVILLWILVEISLRKITNTYFFNDKAVSDEKLLVQALTSAAASRILFESLSDNDKCSSDNNTNDDDNKR